MKIEIGESLMYSWLRHVKKCQIAQLNWKTATVDASLFSEVQPVFDVFREKLQLRSNLKQFLSQAEIDVLGISVKEHSNELYAVDIAFHEAGLGYSDSVDRVAKKLLRSALVLHNQFGTRKGHIIFACPKINSITTTTEIQNHLAYMTDVFRNAGFEFNFNMICNTDFREQILQEVVRKAKDIKDTSDLFVRSLKMIGIFNGEIGAINLAMAVDNEESFDAVADVDNPIINQEDELNMSFSELLSLDRSIGKTARAFFNKMVQENKLADFFARYGNVNVQGYPVLKEVTNMNTMAANNEAMDAKGRSRYYANTLTENGRTFLLCSQWYPKHLAILIDAAENMKLN